jgi:hypothetical protein
VEGNLSARMSFLLSPAIMYPIDARSIRKTYRIRKTDHSWLAGDSLETPNALPVLRRSVLGYCRSSRITNYTWRKSGSIDGGWRRLSAGHGNFCTMWLYGVSKCCNAKDFAQQE